MAARRDGAGPNRSAGEDPDVAVAMLFAEIDDLFFSRGGVRFRVDKHQMLGGHVVDSIGLDVKVVVVADDKCHFEKLLELTTVSVAGARFNSPKKSARGRVAGHASRKICGNRHLDTRTRESGNEYAGVDSMSLKGKAAAIGIGELKPVKEPGDLTALGLMAKVAAEAFADAGLEKKDIDGFLVGVPFSDPGMIYPASAAEVLGLNVRMLNQVDIGGASPAGMIWRAAAAIDAGMCNAVLCIVADLNKAGDQRPPVISVQREFEAPYGNIGANCGYAMIAHRHMHEYGTTPQQMAKVAVDQRTSALKNPLATFNDKALTIDEVLNSRMIVDPLHLYEIVSPVSGGAAIIVASPEVAKRAKNPPIWLLGAGEYANHSTITYAPSITESPIKPAAEAAFKMAGLQPKDMDLVCPYDCYTITVIVTLEDAGFCRKGRGGQFVMEHDLTYAGDFPCNTHGGQLSFGQPGLAGGMSHVTEAIRQLMGRGGERQVKNAALGYVNGNGGIMSEQASLVLERRS
jgi:acetyl-CoA C-acetyltransferase